MDDANVPAAAQISQADIIERQAETIARLKKQVQKGSEYKQLTKSKLKEAAVRLKEYRLRVETLLRAEETLKQQLKTEQTAHAKTKELHKSALNQVKAKKQAHVSTQTDEKTKVTRTSQTVLSGQVERVIKKTMVDTEVQTVDVVVDTFTSRKRGRTSTQTQMDQMVPKLSRHSPKEALEDSLTMNAEPIQLIGRHSTTFRHETSAALDAELAFSDSDVETGEKLTRNSIMESGENSELIAFDPTVSSEIDKELDFSDDEFAETKKHDVLTGQKTNTDAGVSLLSGFDAAVQSEIDKELESSEDEQVETCRKRYVETRLVVETAEKAVLFDAIADEIDKDLETSSDEEDNEKININAATKDRGRDDDNGRTLVSIDYELDGEFAALESDSEPENQGKHAGASSSSSSSDSDSSDSSDSNSDDDGDDAMAGTADKKTIQIADTISPGLIAEKECDREPSTADAVVLTTPIEKNIVSASEVYSPIVEAESSLQTPDPLQLNTTATEISHSKNKEDSGDVNYPPSPVQKSIPNPLQSTQTVDEDANNSAVLPAIIDARSPQPAVSTPSDEEDKPATEESTSISTQSFDHPLDSRTTERGELVHSSTEAVRTATDALDSESLSPNDISLKRSRKADEAKLNGSASAQKKAKRAEASNEVKSPANKAMKPVNSESKDEWRMKKSLTLFKQAILLSKGEEADSKYARRTITVLVNQSSRFIDMHDHVTALCQLLADTFQELNTTPIEVVCGSLGVFRTPRSRRLLQENKLGLSWLVNQLLLRLVSHGDTLNLSNVDECLLHLRGFLVEERTNIDEFLSTSKAQTPVTTQHVNVSHDKVFLAHICALHTHLCKATGQLSRARVLLFDIIRSNPDIRGLYFAMVILEIYPEMLEREFDEQCIERQGVLKETLLHAFIVISSTAAARRELLLHQSSLTMLHRIADAIQKPELEQVDGADMCIRKLYIHQLYDQLIGPETDYFELAKSMEICTAVHDRDLVTQIFSIEQCRKLYAKANITAKSGILSVIGRIATRTRSDQYVESVIDWLYEILSSQTMDKVSEDQFKLRVTCSKVCVDLILEYSASSGLNSRRRVLCAVVKWFELIPSDKLLDLPAIFLRRLRLAVLAARPHLVPI
ncbi:hypothetical protein L914_14273 [Phytophthora nicotianae]|uniref:Uncharacterized protein n=1 Tax=Phytophthora nicotianae TaxID=4792 RepID=W2MT80_PHYNI|nr:hypothetical protein L914_14273 [Phytophthora nicotianae]